MFLDARTLPENRVIETDVCIVGAGAAGITLAREFAGKAFRVCLLESGGLEFDEVTQSLYKGENIGLPYVSLEATRMRYFGGTTNVWSGWCRPLQRIDFEPRDWIPSSGWPFRKSHLDPFYKRAQSICKIGPFTYDAGAWEKPENSAPLPFIGDRVTTKIIQKNRVNFGETYREDIEHAKNITTFLYANVVDIETSETAQTITRLRAATLEGNEFSVSARLFILAMGGIEIPRLLLVSNKVQRAGLGNQHDLVGRFFMEHPHFRSGVFLASDPTISVDFYKYHTVNKVLVRGNLTLAEKVLLHEKLLNFSATLDRRSTGKLRGVESLRQIHRAIEKWDMPHDFWGHLRNVIADIDEVAIHAYRKLLDKDYSRGVFKLYNRTEQAPNPESRVTISDERDRLGVNRVRLNWNLQPIDKRSIRRAQEVIGQELGRAGLGRLQAELDDDDTTWPPGLTGGNHHMGTTRMSTDPKQGVVDENCRVHGISNLFIAGSSVFSTSGHANPTLTIVALAVRLADHIKKIMS